MEKDLTQKELLGAIQGIVKKEVDRTGLRSEFLQAVERSQTDVLEAMQEFSSNVDRRFDRIEGRLTRVEATMVTKEYLDDKFAEEGSRYGGMIRETNEKVCAFADALVAEKSLSVPAASRIKLMRPFPRRLPR